MIKIQPCSLNTKFVLFLFCSRHLGKKENDIHGKAITKLIYYFKSWEGLVHENRGLNDFCVQTLEEKIFSKSIKYLA